MRVSLNDKIFHCLNSILRCSATMTLKPKFNLIYLTHDIACFANLKIKYFRNDKDELYFVYSNTIYSYEYIFYISYA